MTDNNQCGCEQPDKRDVFFTKAEQMMRQVEDLKREHANLETLSGDDRARLEATHLLMRSLPPDLLLGMAAKMAEEYVRRGKHLSHLAGITGLTGKVMVLAMEEIQKYLTQIVGLEQELSNQQNALDAQTVTANGYRVAFENAQQDIAKLRRALDQPGDNGGFTPFPTAFWSLSDMPHQLQVAPEAKQSVGDPPFIPVYMFGDLHFAHKG